MAITQFNLLFCSRKKLYSLLGSRSSDLGGYSVEMPARGTGPATFFRDTILLGGGGTFFACGAQAMIWGARPRNAPWHQACIVSLVTIVDIVIIIGLVDVVGLVGIVSKYSRRSRRGRRSLVWEIKTLPCYAY